MPFFSRDFFRPRSRSSSARHRAPPPSLVPPSLTSLSLTSMSRSPTPKGMRTPPTPGAHPPCPPLPPLPQQSCPSVPPKSPQAPAHRSHPSRASQASQASHMSRISQVSEVSELASSTSHASPSASGLTSPLPPYHHSSAPASRASPVPSLASPTSSNHTHPLYRSQEASRSAASLASPRPPKALTRSRAASLGGTSRSAAGVSRSQARYSAPVPPVPPLPRMPPPKGPIPTPTPKADPLAQSRERFDTFEACMEGGIKYETQAAALGYTGDMAGRHLNRAAGLFAAALSYNPHSTWAMLRRATVLMHIAGNASPPAAIGLLRDARSLLTNLTSTAPNSTSARETLATVCSRLSFCLHAVEDQADDVEEVWEGEVGRFACEALEALEDVTAERMDRVRTLRRDAFEGETPGLAHMFLTLADAAGTVASLALDPDTVDSHAELAEHALDQAANMATMAAEAKVRHPAGSAALITRVQLASGRAAAERMRHMFLLGVSLEENDFTSLIADMGLLAKETRDRASRLKGSRGAAAALQAFEAVQQLGDTKFLYANLLRCVWRARRQAILSPADSQSHLGVLGLNHFGPSIPTTPGLVRDSVDGDSRKGSVSSMLSETIESPMIPEEPEPEDACVPPISTNPPPLPKPNTASPTASPTSSEQAPKRTRAPPPPPLKLARPSFAAFPAQVPQLSPLAPRTPLSPLNPSSGSGIARRASDFAGASRPRLPRVTGSAITVTTTNSAPVRPTVTIPSSAPNHVTPLHSPSYVAHKRLSSMSRPNTGNAWERRPPSAIHSPALSPTVDYQSHVPTAELAQTAYNLLDGALKHYKMALTLLSQADVSPVRRAEYKSEVLASIASASLFRAMLAPRIRLTRSEGDHETEHSPKQALNTAEVYSTWAAREVGWSFVIEGTPGAELVDRRTGSWTADEAGKRAVLLTLRVWWYRATSDIGTDKTTAKENVARVVRRLRDLEGVAFGDVARFIAGVARTEGSIDPAEQLFWRSVKRILRGGEDDVL